MTYYITFTITGDLDLTPAETITGIKEDLAAYSERYGIVHDVRVHAEEPLPPKQLSIADTLLPLSASPPSRQKKSKPSKPEFTPPLLPDVLTYAAERRASGKGVTDDQAEQWYDDKERGGWTWGKEVLHPIKDWKADFRTRERQIAKDAQERAQATSPKDNGHRPSFDIEAYERSTLIPPKFEEEYL